MVKPDVRIGMPGYGFVQTPKKLPVNAYGRTGALMVILVVSHALTRATVLVLTITIRVYATGAQGGCIPDKG